MNEALREQYRTCLARHYPELARRLAEIPAESVMDALRLTLARPELEEGSLLSIMGACIQVTQRTQDLDDLGCMLLDLWALGVYQGQRGIARVGL